MREDREHASEQGLRVLLNRLQRETRELHRGVEGALDLFGRADAVSRYTAVLATLLGYYAPLEERLAAALERNPPAVPFAPRPKAHLLRLDLARLGHEAPLSFCPATLLPSLENGGRALGCLYVLEGATLGGTVIARHFSRRFGLDAGNGLAFHSGYGDATAQRWQEFRHFATQLSAHHDCRAFDDQAVAGAKETFSTLTAWLQLTLDKPTVGVSSPSGFMRAAAI